MTPQSYRDLEVWQIGMDLAVACYQATKSFPKEERYALTSQIRRAASSIPANISEGKARPHTKKFLYHLGVASGSVVELETHFILSERIGLLSGESVGELLALTDRIGRMLTKLRQALHSRLD